MGYAPKTSDAPTDILDALTRNPSAADRLSWLQYMLERMRFVRADWGWSSPTATSAPIVDEVAGQQALFRVSAVLGSTPDAAHFNERQFATWAVATCPAAIRQLTDALAQMESFVECAARGNTDADTLQSMARDVLDAYTAHPVASTDSAAADAEPAADEKHGCHGGDGSTLAAADKPRDACND